MLVVASIGLVSADLPIHCLSHEVAGEWEFELSAVVDSPQSCGYNQPDMNSFHFGEGSPPQLHAESSFKVTLENPTLEKKQSVAIHQNGKEGVWTMVYDEGFEVQVDDMKFFAFSKYEPKNAQIDTKKDGEVKDYNSLCDATMIGWFKHTNKAGYGCWRGSKVPADTVLLEMSNHHNATSLKFHSTVSKIEQIPMDKMFKQDTALIEMVNSDSTSSWKATKHNKFSDRPLKQMMSMLGRRQFKKARNSAKALKDKRNDKEKYGDLPTAWDWRDVDGVNYVDKVVDQGFCGSCYAMATVSSMTSRFRVATGEVDHPLLSAQNILGCSRTNQGCDGGYPYLAAKYGEDVGFVAESCDTYKDDDVQQGTCTNDQQCAQTRYFAKDYKYVGGYYGGCSEVEMMKEIKERGPVMVAFEAPVSLFYYHGGIFTGPDPEKQEEGTATEWQHTNHAVVAVGWGVDEDKPDPKNNGEPMKYWIIKNTWGDDWGEGGYFKIRRSTDECGIESMAVTAEAVINPSSFYF